MSEQHTGTQPPAGEEPTGQAPTQPTTTEPTGQEPATGDDGAASSDDDGKVDEQTKALRKEAAKYRTELRDAQKKLEALERERMTDAEKAQADAAKATEAANTVTTKAQNALGRAALIAAATEARFHDPAIAADLLAGKLDFDDDFEPVNAADLVKTLAAERPTLVNVGGPGAGGAPGAATPGGQPKQHQSRNDFLSQFQQLG